jgi:hypothetical protein
MDIRRKQWTTVLMTDNLTADRAQTARVQLECVRREPWAERKQNIALRLKKFYGEW